MNEHEREYIRNKMKLSEDIPTDISITDIDQVMNELRKQEPCPCVFNAPGCELHLNFDGAEHFNGDKA